MIERATRALRAHIEEQQEIQGHTGWAVMKAPLETGLDNLLGSSNDIQPFSPGSYERFHPGVWLGYGSDCKDFRVEIKTRCHPPVDHGQLLADAGSSCLVMTVGCQVEASDMWLTLETELDIETVLACQSLEVGYILSFINVCSHPLGPVGLQLGVTHEESYKPEFRKTYPALDMPLELSYRLTADQLLDLPREGIKSLNLMMTLPVPVKGSYTAILSHFEVTVTKRTSI